MISTSPKNIVKKHKPTLLPRTPNISLETKKNNLVGRCFQKILLKWSLLLGKKIVHFSVKGFGTFAVRWPFFIVFLGDMGEPVNDWRSPGNVCFFPVRIQVFLLRNGFIPRIHLNRHGMFRPTILM